MIKSIQLNKIILLASFGFGLLLSLFVSKFSSDTWTEVHYALNYDLWGDAMNSLFSGENIIMLISWGLILPGLLFGVYLLVGKIVNFLSRYERVKNPLLAFLLAIPGIQIDNAFRDGSILSMLGTLMALPFFFFTLYGIYLVVKPFIPILSAIGDAVGGAVESAASTSRSSSAASSSASSASRSSSSGASSAASAPAAKKRCPNCNKELSDMTNPLYECKSCGQLQCSSCSSSHAGANHCMHKDKRLDGRALPRCHPYEGSRGFLKKISIDKL